MNLITKVKTAFLLGFNSLGRVLFYRLSLRAGLNPVTRISAQVPKGALFRMPARAEHDDLEINNQWFGKHTYFGWYGITANGVPEWHSNPFNGERVVDPLRDWWLIPDFDARLGDIKTIWEASRFEWMIGFAQGACQGDETSLNKLNAWTADWIAENPPYRGANWKCGQESSIRVLQLAGSGSCLGYERAGGAVFQDAPFPRPDHV